MVYITVTVFMGHDEAVTEFVALVFVNYPTSLALVSLCQLFVG